MAQNQVASNHAEGNNSNLPVPVTVIVELDKYAATLEALQAMEEEFSDFYARTRQQMDLYRRELSRITSPLYKDVFYHILNGGRGNSLNDPIFGAWHAPGYRAFHLVCDGLSEMGEGIKQARAYTKAMQRSGKR